MALNPFKVCTHLLRLAKTSSDGCLTEMKLFKAALINSFRLPMHYLTVYRVTIVIPTHKNHQTLEHFGVFSTYYVFLFPTTALFLFSLIVLMSVISVVLR